MTVLFDPPYWVGIFECFEGKQYRTARFVFGSEPTAPELLRFALHDYQGLNFSRPMKLEEAEKTQKSYKRQMRDIRKSMREPVVSTRSQLALQQEYILRGLEQQAESKEKTKQTADRLYAVKKAARLEKHRGH